MGDVRSLWGWEVAAMGGNAAVLITGAADTLTKYLKGVFHFVETGQ